MSIRGQSSALSVSISHRAGAALCTVRQGAADVGCDLELIEERSDAFVSDYFTFEEKLKVVMAAQDEEAIVANLIWSAKESVLKVLRTGLNVDTRSVSIDLNSIVLNEGWNEIKAKSLELNQEFWGWWRHMEDYVLTVFSSDICEAPTELPIV